MKHLKLFKKLLLLLCITGTTLSNAQDVRYSQSFGAPLRLNPALMGPNHYAKFILNYRSQWANIDNGYTTERFTFLTPVMLKENNKLDIGVSVVSDKAGAFEDINASLALGYDLQITESSHHISAAIYCGYEQKHLNTQGLTFDEQYVLGNFESGSSNEEAFLKEDINFIDIGFGLLWYYNPENEGEGQINAFAGISGYHMNKPNESLIENEGQLPELFTYITGVKIITNGKLDFSPNIRISTQQGSKDIATGFYTDYRLGEKNNKITFGVWYKQNSAFAFMLGLEISKVTLGYSYDLPGSQLNAVIPNSNTHEITLMFKLDRTKNKEFEYNMSPFSNF